MNWKRLSWAVVLALVVVGAIAAAFRLSPWPAVMLIRQSFDRDAADRNAALVAHAPDGIVERRDIPYGSDASEKLDLYLPGTTANSAEPPPLVAWIHGGAFIAGDRRDVEGYARVLAGRGFAVAAIGYAIAPGSRYPEPVRQAGAALGWLVANATGHGYDPSRIVLAGDSAGAQIAAQLAAIVTDPGYAEETGIEPETGPASLRGVALFCGVYDAGAIDLDGGFGGFMRTVLWSYFGSKDPAAVPDGFSVARHISATFPPAFVSVGNADPLSPHSENLVDALEAAGVRVDSLFFPSDYTPRLEHEYQFHRDGDAGKQALERLVAFLEARLGP